MRLISLVVSSAIDDEIIRTIKFNEKGLSLIVDETNNQTSGSNIGKTTAVKIIDLCLGAKSVSSIYKEKDTGENHLVKEFVESKKVVAELNARIGQKIYSFKRALYRNGKNEINGRKVKNATEYRKELNSIIFNNTNDKPSFRQLITKFVRLDNANENSLLKYLGVYTKNYQYQAIYNYLYGLYISKSQNVDIIALNERIDKDIEAIYRKNGISSLSEFETQIQLMKEELEKFKKAYAEVTVVDDYKDKKATMDRLLAIIDKLEGMSARENLRVNLMEEKIAREKGKIFSVDDRILKKLYNETKGIISGPIREFKELQEFHNGMVNKRLEILMESYKEKKEVLSKIDHKLSELHKSYESQYVTFNSQLRDKFEEKYADFSANKVKYENANNDYQYIIKMQQAKEKNLEKKVTEDSNANQIENIKKILNDYFKYYTEQIVGETFAMVFKEGDDEFPIELVGMNGKPGAGIKKAMITCFDLAHISLIIKEHYHMPEFEIHDKMENIDLVELGHIVDVARKFEGQYIFPILNDRIEKLGITKDEIVLSLSSNDKFFHI